MHLSGPELALALASVIVGATIQGSVGYGMNLVTVPVLALLEPEALPAPLILLGLPLGAAMAMRERRAVDWRGLGWITAGRIPGTLLGVLIVARVSPDALSTVIGVSLLLAVAASLPAWTVPVNRETTLAAGFVSGTTGTAAAIGGPPLALLYQHHEGPVLRATLAAAFCVGTVLSLVGLLLGDQVRWWQVGLSLALAPGLVVGLAASRLLAPVLDRRWLRPAVLSFAAVTGVVAVVRGVW